MTDPAPGFELGPFAARPADDVAALYRDAVAYEVVGPESVDPEMGGGVLLAGETEVIARAVPNRRRQFAAGRHCAHLAMADHGLPPLPVLAGPERAPLWPAGVRGSISHTEGYVVAVVRLMADAGNGGGPIDGVAVGVDAEVIGRVGDHLFARLFTDGERAWLASLGPADRALAATAVFGAKEAFYKAQFPLTGAWVGFHDVESRPVDPVRPGGGGLVLEPHTALPALQGLRWPCRAAHRPRGNVLVSAVEVEAT